MDRVREVEHKFQVRNSYRIPDLTAVEGVGRVVDAGTSELVAAYYDTHDLRLMRDGITLRHRTGGSDEGWHLKLPTGTTGARDELHLPHDTSTGEPPSELAWTVAVVTRDNPVRPVVSLHTARHLYYLHDSHDELIAELVDDHVTAVPAEGEPTTRFRELELEVRADAPAVSKLITLLAADSADTSAFVTKAARALSPDAMAHPEVPVPPDVHPRDAAATCVTAYLATHVRALRQHDIGFRADPTRPGDHIHQMRVSARRLRSGLRAFSRLLDEAWAKELSAELRWFGRGLSEMRETEVLLPRLEHDARELAAASGSAAEVVLPHIQQQLGTRLDQARDDVIALLSTGRYLALHDQLVEAVREPHFSAEAQTPAAEIFPDLVRDAWSRLERQVARLTPDSSDERWHKVRLAAKRARYAGETVAPALGAPATTYVKKVKRLTAILGEHQDAAQAADQVTELAAHPSISNDSAVAFQLGAIAGLERGRAKDQRAHFTAAWRKSRNAGKLLHDG